MGIFLLGPIVYNYKNVYSMGGFPLGEIHFLHTADIHLDSPFSGLHNLPKAIFEQIQESTFLAFQNVIDAAIEKQVDFVLIVGDLYDGEDRSIKAQARLLQQMKRLEKAGIHAFIVHGNHDHLGGNWITLDLPTNVHIFGEEVEVKTFVTNHGQKVHLYGFSYAKRHLFERKILNYQKKDEADFHIGLLHGQWEKGNKSHQPYAPFSIEELLRTTFDYWALGHIHKREILHKDPYIVYPGNTQGTKVNETGLKGCYEVVLHANGTTELEFIPTSAICWENIEIHFIEGMSFTDLYQQCKEQMKILLDERKVNVLVNIVIHKQHPMPFDIKQSLLNGEFLEVLQDDFEMTDYFIWPYALHVKDSGQHSPEFKHDFFLEALQEVAKDHNWIDESIAPLFSHIYASRYLNPLNEEEKKQLIDEAKRFVVNLLGY